MASKKCKEHQWQDTPLTARNGRKYSKCRVCGAVDYSAKLLKELQKKPVTEQDVIVLAPYAKKQRVDQLSMVEEHTGVPFAYNTEDGSRYYKTPKRKRNQVPVRYVGLVV